MKIILCSAVKKEIEKILRHFNAVLLSSIKNKYHIYHYSNRNNEIYFIITGVGRKNIRKNLEYFIKKYNLSNNFFWILTGYAGSITDNFKIGDIVVPGLIRDEKNIYNLNQDILSPLINRVNIFKVSRVYGEREKRDLKANYPDVDIIDMESTAFYEVMKKNDFKNYYIYKSITDDLTFKFPDFRLIKDSIFKIKFKGFLILLKNLRQVKDLFSIYRNMSKASKSIYKFFITLYTEYEDQSN